jgi:hypothetical protein
VRAFQPSAFRSFAVVFAAVLAFVLVWGGTVGLGLSSGVPGVSRFVESSAACDTAERSKLDSLPVGKTEHQASGESAGEESLDESDTSDASFAPVQVTSFVLDGTSLEFVGSETTRSRRLVVCVGARGPPVG